MLTIFIEKRRLITIDLVVDIFFNREKHLVGNSFSYGEYVNDEG